MTRRLLSTREVAAKFGFSPEWLYKARRRLAERGFPAPVLGFGRGRHARWDEAAIDLWLDRQMPRTLRADAACASLDADLDARLSRVALDIAPDRFQPANA